MAIVETPGWVVSVGGNITSATTKQGAIDAAVLMDFPGYGENQTFIYPVTLLSEDS